MTSDTASVFPVAPETVTSITGPYLQVQQVTDHQVDVQVLHSFRASFPKTVDHPRAAFPPILRDAAGQVARLTDLSPSELLDQKDTSDEANLPPVHTTSDLRLLASCTRAAGVVDPGLLGGQRPCSSRNSGTAKEGNLTAGAAEPSALRLADLVEVGSQATEPAASAIEPQTVRPCGLRNSFARSSWSRAWQKASEKAPRSDAAAALSASNGQAGQSALTFWQRLSTNIAKLPTLFVTPQLQGHAAALASPAFPSSGRGEWELDPVAILLGRRIAVGGFAEVFVGKYQGTVVAIKRLLNNDVATTERFIREIKLLARLRHPNLILFMGYCVAPELCIISEFMSRGSLYHVLRERKGDVLPLKLQRAIAVSVARGMLYLHTRDPPILHLDLKSPNILIDDRWRVKIADFGLSRVRSRTYVSSAAGGGTPEWMAPEVLRCEPFDERADVYSFGVVLWELLTGEAPWESLNPMQVVGAVGWSRRALSPPEGADPFLRRLSELCLQWDAVRRPTFHQVVELIDEEYGPPAFSRLTHSLLGPLEPRALIEPSLTLQAESAPAELGATVSQPLELVHPFVQPLDLGVTVRRPQSVLEPEETSNGNSVMGTSPLGRRKERSPGGLPQESLTAIASKLANGSKSPSLRLPAQYESIQTLEHKANNEVFARRSPFAVAAVQPFQSSRSSSMYASRTHSINGVMFVDHNGVTEPDAVKGNSSAPEAQELSNVQPVRKLPTHVSRPAQAEIATRPTAGVVPSDTALGWSLTAAAPMAFELAVAEPFNYDATLTGEIPCATNMEDVSELGLHPSVDEAHTLRSAVQEPMVANNDSALAHELPSVVATSVPDAAPQHERGACAAAAHSQALGQAQRHSGTQACYEPEEFMQQLHRRISLLVPASPAPSTCSPPPSAYGAVSPPPSPALFSCNSSGYASRDDSFSSNHLQRDTADWWRANAPDMGHGSQRVGHADMSPLCMPAADQGPAHTSFGSEPACVGASQLEHCLSETVVVIPVGDGNALVAKMEGPHPLTPIPESLPNSQGTSSQGSRPQLQDLVQAQLLQHAVAAVNAVHNMAPECGAMLSSQGCAPASGSQQPSCVCMEVQNDIGKDLSPMPAAGEILCSTTAGEAKTSAIGQRPPALKVYRKSHSTPGERGALQDASRGLRQCHSYQMGRFRVTSFQVQSMDKLHSHALSAPGSMPVLASGSMPGGPAEGVPQQCISIAALMSRVPSCGSLSGDGNQSYRKGRFLVQVKEVPEKLQKKKKSSSRRPSNNGSSALLSPASTCASPTRTASSTPEHQGPLELTSIGQVWGSNAGPLEASLGTGAAEPNQGHVVSASKQKRRSSWPSSNPGSRTGSPDLIPAGSPPKAPALHDVHASDVAAAFPERSVDDRHAVFSLATLPPSAEASAVGVTRTSLPRLLNTAMPAVAIGTASQPAVATSPTSASSRPSEGSSTSSPPPAPEPRLPDPVMQYRISNDLDHSDQQPAGSGRVPSASAQAPDGCKTPSHDMITAAPAVDQSPSSGTLRSRRGKDALAISPGAARLSPKEIGATGSMQRSGAGSVTPPLHRGPVSCTSPDLLCSGPPTRQHLTTSLSHPHGLDRSWNAGEQAGIGGDAAATPGNLRGYPSAGSLSRHYHKGRFDVHEDFMILDKPVAPADVKRPDAAAAVVTASGSAEAVSRSCAGQPSAAMDSASPEGGGAASKKLGRSGASTPKAVASTGMSHKHSGITSALTSSAKEGGTASCKGSLGRKPRLSGGAPQAPCSKGEVPGSSGGTPPMSPGEKGKTGLSVSTGLSSKPAKGSGTPSAPSTPTTAVVCNKRQVGRFVVVDEYAPPTSAAPAVCSAPLPGALANSCTAPAGETAARDAVCLPRVPPAVVKGLLGAEHARSPRKPPPVGCCSAPQRVTALDAESTIFAMGMPVGFRPPFNPPELMDDLSEALHETVSGIFSASPQATLSTSGDYIINGSPMLGGHRGKLMQAAGSIRQPCTLSGLHPHTSVFGLGQRSVSGGSESGQPAAGVTAGRAPSMESMDCFPTFDDSGMCSLPDLGVLATDHSPLVHDHCSPGSGWSPQVLAVPHPAPTATNEAPSNVPHSGSGAEDISVEHDQLPDVVTPAVAAWSGADQRAGSPALRFSPHSVGGEAAVGQAGEVGTRANTMGAKELGATSGNALSIDVETMEMDVFKTLPAPVRQHFKPAMRSCSPSSARRGCLQVHVVQGGSGCDSDVSELSDMEGG